MAVLTKWGDNHQHYVIGELYIFDKIYLSYCLTRLHLGFSAELRIWQALASQMEPQSGIIFGQNQPDPPDRLV